MAKFNMDTIECHRRLIAIFGKNKLDEDIVKLRVKKTFLAGSI